MIEPEVGKKKKKEDTERRKEKNEKEKYKQEHTMYKDQTQKKSKRGTCNRKKNVLFIRRGKTYTQSKKLKKNHLTQEQEYMHIMKNI